MDYENLRVLLQILGLAGTGAWLALGGLCLFLWRRERVGWYGRLAAGFLLLGLNRLLTPALAWLLEPIYAFVARDIDPFGEGSALLDSLASSALALIAIMLIGLAVAHSARRGRPMTEGPPWRRPRGGRGERARR